MEHVSLQSVPINHPCCSAAHPSQSSYLFCRKKQYPQSTAKGNDNCFSGVMHCVLPILASLLIFGREKKEVVGCSNCLIESLFFRVSTRSQKLGPLTLSWKLQGYLWFILAYNFIVHFLILSSTFKLSGSSFCCIQLHETGRISCNAC